MAQALQAALQVLAQLMVSVQTMSMTVTMMEPSILKTPLLTLMATNSHAVVAPG
jgi:hypothetical protein